MGEHSAKSARVKGETWKKNTRLTPESRAQLAEMNLRFHDLRREAGSRLLDGGMAPNDVQEFLDHAKMSTSSRYLKVTQHGMHVALKRYEETREVATMPHGTKAWKSSSDAGKQPKAKLSE